MTTKAERASSKEEEKWKAYYAEIAAGLTPFQASKLATTPSWSTIRRHLRDSNSVPAARKIKAVFDAENPHPAIPHDQLGDEAKRALTDFGYFRQRYMGHLPTPWQIDAGQRLVELLNTPHEEYVVVNVPPGSGKSTTFTFDIPTWLIVRDRAIRIMIGSATERTARSYGGRLRRALERTEPVKNPQKDIIRGLSVDAAASLVQDFGRFKPMSRDLWRAEEFVVEQLDGATSDEKEATVATFGRDGGFLGGRYDFVIWDDLVTSKVLKTIESREALQNWWQSEAETRLEPGGVLVLQGQRLHADDLYRFALDMRGIDLEDELGGGDPDADADATRKYKHIVYKAHNADTCQGKHSVDAPPFDPANPETSGCLLDPRRLNWRKLATIQKNELEKFLVIYQQEDTDPAQVLVNPLWVNGGTDPTTGETFPGVWDKDRSAGVIPKGLAKPWFTVVTADPSPSRFWSIQWWLYHPSTEQRLLLDHARQVMTAPDFLEWHDDTRTYTGLLEEWWQRAKDQGHPFKHVIVEDNAAQRFMLQYEFVRRWASLRGVTIIGHQTHRNKTDEKFGVQTIAPHWQYGRVRLPGNPKDGSRAKSLSLVDEVTRWPESKTEDCVMAEWFFEFRLKSLYRPERKEALTFKRPSWLAGRSA